MIGTIWLGLYRVVNIPNNLLHIDSISPPKSLLTFWLIDITIGDHLRLTLDHVRLLLVGTVRRQTVPVRVWGVDITTCQR